MHLGFDAASAVVAAQSSPERTTEVFRSHSASLRAAAPVVIAFHGLAALQREMTAWAPRSAMLPWHFQVS